MVVMLENLRNVILMIGVSKEFAPHLWKEARKAGFITEG